jgi:hypothetical protein
MSLQRPQAPAPAIQMLIEAVRTSMWPPVKMYVMCIKNLFSSLSLPKKRSEFCVFVRLHSWKEFFGSQIPAHWSQLKRSQKFLLSVQMATSYRRCHRHTGHIFNSESSTSAERESLFWSLFIDILKLSNKINVSIFFYFSCAGHSTTRKNSLFEL